MPFCFVLHTQEWFIFFFNTRVQLISRTVQNQNLPSPNKSLAAGFYLGLLRGVEENKWFSCDTEISRQDPDTEGKISAISVPFLLQELGIPPSTLAAKRQHFSTKLGPFSSGAEGSFCPLCQDHPQMKGDGNGNTKYNPLFTSPAATNLLQHQCREKILPKVWVRDWEENGVFAMSQSSPSHPCLPISMASLRQHKAWSGGFV